MNEKKKSNVQQKNQGGQDTFRNLVGTIGNVNKKFVDSGILSDRYTSINSRYKMKSSHANKIISD